MTTTCNSPLMMAAAFLLPETFVTTGDAEAIHIDFVTKIVADDGAAHDLFGSSVALSGGTALVGSPFDDDDGEASGSAYVFDAVSGTLNRKLTASDAAIDDRFGWSVSLSNSNAHIGTYLDDDNGNASGSSYLFNAETGAQLYKLLPNDGAPGDFYGRSVSIFGDNAVGGAQLDDDGGSETGSAYLFEVANGTQVHKFNANDGSAGDRLGWSVAVSNDFTLAGAHRDDVNGADVGSAYLFDNVTGNQVRKFVADDGQTNDSFGWSVRLSEQTAVVGAPRDDDGVTGNGAAYLFDLATGTQFAKLIAPDGAEFDRFGYSVDIDGRFVLIGSNRDDDNGNGSGSAYLFDSLSGDFIGKLLAPDGASGDEFGWSVAIDGNLILVGARAANVGGITNQGAAYVFRVVDVPKPAALFGFSLMILLSCYRLKQNEVPKQFS